MQDLFSKIDYYIDYRNHYSVKKALTTLGREFDIAVSKNNVVQAKAAIDAVRKIHDKLGSMYKESEGLGETMSFSQKILSKQMRSFISHLTSRLRAEFGIRDNEKEIEQTISQTE